MKLNHVGIDVSAKTFTVIIDHEGTRSLAFDLPNDAKGHKKLIRMVTKKGFQAKVVLEATGVYSLDLPCERVSRWLESETNNRLLSYGRWETGRLDRTR